MIALLIILLIHWLQLVNLVKFPIAQTAHLWQNVQNVIKQMVLFWTMPLNFAVYVWLMDVRYANHRVSVKNVIVPKDISKQAMENVKSCKISLECNLKWMWKRVAAISLRWLLLLLKQVIRCNKSPNPYIFITKESKSSQLIPWEIKSNLNANKVAHSQKRK